MGRPAKYRYLDTSTTICCACDIDRSLPSTVWSQSMNDFRSPPSIRYLAKCLVQPSHTLLPIIFTGALLNAVVLARSGLSESA